MNTVNNKQIADEEALVNAIVERMYNVDYILRKDDYSIWSGNTKIKK